MKKHIEFDWPILSGSISTAKSQCGKEGCACKTRRSPRLHGNVLPLDRLHQWGQKDYENHQQGSRSGVRTQD
jgi:hypothetical protein